KEVGDGAEGRREPLRDGLADLGQGDVIVRSRGALGKRETGNGKGWRGRCARRALEILLNDSAAGPRAGYELQVYAGLLRHAPREWGRLYAGGIRGSGGRQRSDNHRCGGSHGRHVSRFPFAASRGDRRG